MKIILCIFFFFSAITANLLSNSNLGIIGGQKAIPHRYPYQVGLWVTKISGLIDFCGGSLISRNYVLTAAQCVNEATSMIIILGAHNIYQKESTQVRDVSGNIKIHSEFDEYTFANDIALVRLSRPINVTNSIGIIKVASGNDTFASEEGILTGWGKTDDLDKTVTPYLRYAVSEVMTNANCSKEDAEYQKLITPSLICLSGKDGKASCEGDIGGPLVVNQVQVGISSFPHEHCSGGKPSVFTRLTKYTDWLKENSDIVI